MFDEGANAATYGYDYGEGNWGVSSTVTNSTVNGSDVLCEGVDPLGTNKNIGRLGAMTARSTMTRSGPGVEPSPDVHDQQDRDRVVDLRVVEDHPAAIWSTFVARTSREIRSKRVHLGPHEGIAIRGEDEPYAGVFRWSEGFGR